MQASRALDIVEALADGVDPHSGEVFPDSSPYQHPDTVRALYAAIVALKRAVQYERRQSRLPENAGKPWEADEEQRLAAEFDRGFSVQNLAEMHGRTRGAIASRLERLGKLVDQASDGGGSPQARGALNISDALPF